MSQIDQRANEFEAQIRESGYFTAEEIDSYVHIFRAGYLTGQSDMPITMDGLIGVREHRPITQ